MKVSTKFPINPSTNGRENYIQNNMGTDGQTKKQTDGPADGPTDGPTNRPTDKPTDGPTDKVNYDGAILVSKITSNSVRRINIHTSSLKLIYSSCCSSSCSLGLIY
jgi:hypothetical protein